MTSIPVGKCRFSNKKFKRLYLKKERVFFDFLLHLWNSHEIYKILQKKEEYHSLIITKIFASEKDVYLSV